MTHSHHTSPAHTAGPEAQASGPDRGALSAQGSTAVDRMNSDASATAGADSTSEPTQYYTVRDGDTLSSIAQHVLHDRGAWLTLWNLNRHLVANPSKMRVGTVLVLPTTSQLQSTSSQDAAPTTETAPAASADSSAQAPSSSAPHAGDASPLTQLGQAESLLRRYGDLLRERASAMNIPLEVAVAIILVEASGDGIRDGRLVIRFEPSVFRRLTGRRVGDSHRSQDAEYAALGRAQRINREAADESTSMGAGQVMGFNARSLHFDSAEAMMESFQDERNQISSMLEFIAGDAHLLQAVRTGDYTTFARIYNGPRQRGYDRKIGHAVVVAINAIEMMKSEVAV